MNMKAYWLLVLFAACLFAAYQKGRADGTLNVEYGVPRTPWADHTTAFCVGCKPLRGGAIYAGITVPGDEGWRIENVLVDLDTKRIGCIGDHPRETATATATH